MFTWDISSVFFSCCLCCFAKCLCEDALFVPKSKRKICCRVYRSTRDCMNLSDWADFSDPRRAGLETNLLCKGMDGTYLVRNWLRALANKKKWNQETVAAVMPKQGVPEQKKMWSALFSVNESNYPVSSSWMKCVWATQENWNLCNIFAWCHNSIRHIHNSKRS